MSPSDAQARPVRPRYVPALDGIRALAVVAVVAYHLDMGGATGGFLGVEVFFVLSGYLITTLLLRERRQAHSIGLKAFWNRRAHRLLPAVIAMIAVVCAFSALLHPADLVTFRDDALASLLYVQNWWAIVDHQPYFEQFGRPSPFMHLWSLAIEEQFYLLWPLALAGALRYLGKAKTFALTLVLAGLSVWAMGPAVGHHPHRARLLRHRHEDVRVALRRRPGLRVEARRAAAGAGHGQRETGARRVVGGRAGRPPLAARPPQRVRRVDLSVGPRLGRPPVARARRRRRRTSHRHGEGPRHAAAGHRGQALLLPLPLALAGHRVPRAGPGPALRRLARPRRAARGHRRHGRGLVPVGRRPLPDQPRGRDRACPHRDALGHAPPSHDRVRARRRGGDGCDRRGRADGPTPSESPLAAPAAERRAVPTTATTAEPVAPDTSVPPTSSSVAETSPASVTTAPPPTTATTTPLLIASPVPVSVIGESVTLAAEGEIEQRFTTASVDAEVGRQFGDTETAVESLAQQGTLSSTVVVHAGNNGPIPAGGLDELLGAIGDRHLVLMTVHVPRRWEAQVNDTLHAFVESHPDVTLVDWKAAVQADPGLVGDDGVHLTATGIRRYVDLIAGVVTPA